MVNARSLPVGSMIVGVTVEPRTVMVVVMSRSVAMEYVPPGTKMRSLMTPLALASWIAARNVHRLLRGAGTARCRARRPSRQRSC